jgi:hypothetical protein
LELYLLKSLRPRQAVLGLPYFGSYSEKFQDGEGPKNTVKNLFLTRTSNSQKKGLKIGGLDPS